MEHALRQAVESAARRAEVRESVHRIYAELQQAIDERRPLCSASGRCCRFEQYGHRLYVTTIELAAFVADLKDSAGSAGSFADAILRADPAGCPFQTSHLCGVHPLRPFGCRIFFCDPTAQDWQNEQYEAFHARMKQLHDTLEVPYYYVEWRWALRAMTEAPG